MNYHDAIVENTHYRVSVIDSFHQLRCEGSDQSVLFSSIEWFRLQENIINSDLSAIRIYICEDSQNFGTRLIFPFYTTKSSRLGLKEDGLFSLSNYYTPCYSPPGADTTPDALLIYAVKEVLKPRHFSYMVLRPIDSTEKIWLNVLATLKDQHWVTISEFEFGNWYQKVNGGYSDYFNSRPSNVKNTYKRKRRLFDRIENSRFEIICNADELSKYIRDYSKVYENSWKKEEPHAQFMPELIRLAASRGELRLGFAYIGEVPIAAHLWLVSDDIASIFKLSYDGNYSQLSPGTLVMCKMLEYVMDIDKVKKIDFLSGDDQYKKNWMSSRREMKAIYAYNLLSIGGVLRFTCHSSKNMFGGIWTLIKQYFPFFESAEKVQSSS